MVARALRNALRCSLWHSTVSAAALAALLGAAGSGAAAPVDEVLRRAMAPKPSDDYTMKADFAVLLTIRYGGGGLLTATARGALVEWHRPGEALHRRLAIHEMHLPLALRPFTSVVQRVIERRIETQPDELPDVQAQDVFAMTDGSTGEYALGGVRRDIVTQALAAYGPARAPAAGETELRRAVAKWLFTSPMMRPRIVRSGPPYALEAVVDAEGLLRTFSVFYDWGTLHTSIDYTTLRGAPVWKRLQSNVATQLPTLGRVAGEVTISLSNECLDCAAAQTYR
jgi:hypothetical protein